MTRDRFMAQSGIISKRPPSPLSRRIDFCTYIIMSTSTHVFRIYA